MAPKALPPQDFLRKILRYEPDTGKLFWLRRPDASDHWNNKYADQEAFTNTDRKGYRRGRVTGVPYQAHRIIWKMQTGENPAAIDHINGDKGDNRIANLRSCTTAENSRNYAKIGDFTSRYRGVCWVKRDQKWSATINAQSRKMSLGHFADEAAAARAYDRAAIVHHGDFAVLNFPQADYAALADGEPT